MTPLSDFLTVLVGMFGIGMPELMVILAVALIVLGPKRLPDVAKSLGKALNDFRRATSGIGEEIESARVTLEEEGRKMKAASGVTKKPAPPTPPSSAKEPDPPAPPKSSTDET